MIIEILLIIEILGLVRYGQFQATEMGVGILTGGFINKMFTDTDKTHTLEFMCSYLKMSSIVRGNVMNETLTKDL